jgi:hypothetical protein
MSANNLNNRINYNHLNSDLERNKRNRIDNEMNKYNLNNGIKIKETIHNIKNINIIVVTILMEILLVKNYIENIRNKKN